MNQNSMFGLMDVVLLLGGLYILYGYYALVVQGEIKQGLLISKSTDPKKCKDFEGFKAFIGKRTLAFGLATTAMGGVGLIQDNQLFPVPQYVYWTLFVLFFVVLIWYTAATRKAEKNYF